jgi:hypothetical protein
MQWLRMDFRIFGLIIWLVQSLSTTDSYQTAIGNLLFEALYGWKEDHRCIDENGRE